MDVTFDYCANLKAIRYASTSLDRIVADKSHYYALNKILNSDWLNTNLTLVDIWLAGSNVRQRNLMSDW